MSNATLIPCDERFDRVKRGLPSNPATSVLLLQEVASLPLDELFDGEQWELATFVKPLFSRGIVLRSSLGMAAGAFKDAMEQDSLDQRELLDAGVALAEVLGRKCESKTRKDDRQPPKAESCATPEAAPLSQRFAAVTKAAAPSRSLKRVGMMNYATYLKVADEAAGTDQADARREWLEANWTVEPRVNFMAVVLHIVKHDDDMRVLTLVDHFILAPLAGVMPAARGPESPEEPVAGDVQEFRFEGWPEVSDDLAELLGLLPDAGDGRTKPNSHD